MFPMTVNLTLNNATEFDRFRALVAGEHVSATVKVSPAANTAGNAAAPAGAGNAKIYTKESAKLLVPLIAKKKGDKGASVAAKFKELGCASAAAMTPEQAQVFGEWAAAEGVTL